MAGIAGSGSRSNSDGGRVPFHLGVVMAPTAPVARALRSRVSMHDMTTGKDGFAN